jgi:hypothetical protein
VFLRNSTARLISIPSFAVLIFIFCKSAFATEEGGIFGVHNFAFSNYLGTGFYTTSGQNVFVIQFPFDHTIVEKTDSEAGWLLNLPITIG